MDDSSKNAVTQRNGGKKTRKDEAAPGHPVFFRHCPFPISSIVARDVGRI
jgi:hypothetical protein